MSVKLNGVEYLTTDEFLVVSGRSDIRSIYHALANELIPGAVRLGWQWIIPATAHILDRRVRSGKYVGYRLRKKMRDIANSV